MSVRNAVEECEREMANKKKSIWALKGDLTPMYVAMLLGLEKAMEQVRFIRLVPHAPPYSQPRP